MYFDQTAKIYVAGHRGLVGSAIIQELKYLGYQNLITKTHKELDLVDQKTTEEFICDNKPDLIFLSAAKVGGIYANNSYPVDFLTQNLAIQSNVINSAFKANVKRLIFLGSSCIYPKNCPQPIKEEYLLTSELEPTNRPYALAKIAGIEMCWAYNRQYNAKFLAVMPTNLYGPNDNFDLENSHVLPALLKKIHNGKVINSKNVEIWGSGIPKREFLHSSDLAKALITLANLDDEKYSTFVNSNQCPLVNIGSGSEISIKNLAILIKEIIGYKGDFLFNTKYPDGTLRKILNIDKISSLGWNPRIELHDGISELYRNFAEKND